VSTRDGAGATPAGVTPRGWRRRRLATRLHCGPAQEVLMHKHVIAFALAAGVFAGSSIGCKDQAKGPTGVAVCDRYVAKANACADQIGGDEGQVMKRMTQMQAEMWKDKTQDPDQKRTLPDFCQMALDGAKEQHPTCSW
jgi:hypothetical protein